MSYGARRLVVGMAALFALVPCARATDAGVGSVGQRRTLATFPAAASQAYELGLEACKASEQPESPGLFRCPFTVRLSAGNKVLDQVELFDRACAEPRHFEVDHLLGADPAARAWTTEADGCEVQVAARAVELGPEVTALLVTQRTGQEQFYRRHQLFLASSGKLKEVWRHSEAQGENWSTTSVLPTGRPHQEDIALIDVVSRVHEGAQSATASRLHFDTASQAMVASPLPDARAPLYVLQVGRFPVEKDAYRTRRTSDCLADFDVLSARLFPTLRLPDFFLGMVLTSRAQAKASVDELARCPEAPRGSTVVYRGALKRSHAKDR
jgi:hypothetical protein